MSSDDDDLNKELLQVAGGRAAGGKRGRAAASASEESPSEEVDLNSYVLWIKRGALRLLTMRQSTIQDLTAERDTPGHAQEACQDTHDLAL